MDHGYSSSSVIKIILIIGGRKQGVDHRDYCANACGAKPGPNKFWTVGKHEENTILHTQPCFTKRIARFVGPSDRVRIRPGSILKIQADFVSAPFIHIVVKEIVRHIKMFWKGDCHFGKASGILRSPLWLGRKYFFYITLEP